MSKCNLCGETIPSNGLYCPKCGKILNNKITDTHLSGESFTVKVPTITPKHKKYFSYAGIIAVVLVIASFLWSWVSEELQFRNYAKSHDYTNLGYIITQSDTTMSKKERAIEAIITAGDNDAAKFIENMLVSVNLPQDVDKLVWQTLTKHKLILPGGMALLSKGKTYPNTSDIQQYFAAVLPVEQEISSMKQIGSELAKTEDITALSAFFTNTSDIINTLPEKDKEIFLKVKNNINAWLDAVQKKEQADTKIKAAKTKVTESERIINDRMNKIHSLVMAAYKARNLSVNAAYMDEGMKSNLAAHFNQIDATTRAMTNDLSGGDPAKRALIYLDIANRFGDPDINKQVATFGGEITVQAEALTKNREEYNRVQASYDLTKLSRQAKRSKDEIIVLLGNKPDGITSSVNQKSELSSKSPVKQLSLVSTEVKKLKNSEGKVYYESKTSVTGSGYNFDILFVRFVGSPGVNVYVTGENKNGDFEYPWYFSNIELSATLNTGEKNSFGTRLTSQDNQDDKRQKYKLFINHRVTRYMQDMKSIIVKFSILDKTQVEYNFEFNLPENIINDWKQIINAKE